jgi:hypothetical protein
MVSFNGDTLNVIVESQDGGKLVDSYEYPFPTITPSDARRLIEASLALGWSPEKKGLFEGPTRRARRRMWDKYRASRKQDLTSGDH